MRWADEDEELTLPPLQKRGRYENAGEWIDRNGSSEMVTIDQTDLDVRTCLMRIRGG